MIDLEKDIKFVKGVGPNRATLLNKLGIYNLKDLITYFPREHEDRGKPKTIAELEDGQEALICAYPVARMNEVRIRGNLTLCKLIVRDETGTMQITWYNQSYLKNTFKPNERYKFFGKVSKKYGKAEMQSPVYELEFSNKNTGKIICNVKKYDLQLRQMKDTEKRDKYKVYGELINTYGYGVEAGAKSMKALNYYTNETIIIPLDNTLTPQENSQKYFDK